MFSLSSFGWLSSYHCHLQNCGWDSCLTQLSEEIQGLWVIVHVLEKHPGLRGAQSAGAAVFIASFIYLFLNKNNSRPEYLLSPQVRNFYTFYCIHSCEGKRKQHKYSPQNCNIFQIYISGRVSQFYLVKHLTVKETKKESRWILGLNLPLEKRKTGKRHGGCVPAPRMMVAHRRHLVGVGWLNEWMNKWRNDFRPTKDVPCWLSNCL